MPQIEIDETLYEQLLDLEEFQDLSIQTIISQAISDYYWTVREVYPELKGFKRNEYSSFDYLGY